MTPRALAGMLLLVSVAALPATADAQCPDWDEMLEEGSLVPVEAVLGDEIDLTLWIAYLNPPRLGECALGAQLYEWLASGLLRAGPPAQAFWVGITGDSADEFSPQQLWVVQDDRELGLSLKGEYDAPTRVSTLEDLDGQFLVVYADELDATRPMRLIYISSIGPVSSEYHVPQAYR